VLSPILLILCSLNKIIMDKRSSLLLTLILINSLIGALQAQGPRQASAGEIHQKIQKLNFLGSALYVAAHPDDENTRLISYLSNQRNANVAYLSLTRGDGGQNLIGPEIRELLGIIRTQELLAARRIDGGDQFFSRANDFGYSKTAEETFNIWNRQQVLADVVWAIRRWQPDIIINRFDHRTSGRTHGHHTASAMLSVEAFDLAGNPEKFRTQLAYFDAWSPQRIFFNTSWWFYGSREAFAKADKSQMTQVDVGAYYPLLGQSNTEIAAASRSMHKCQGFGATPSRGEEIEYLELIKGDMVPSDGDLFEGINTTWTRVKGGAPIGELLHRVQEEFDYEQPAASVPDLLEAYKMIQQLDEGYWKRVKLAEIKDVIKDCLGLYAEAIAERYSSTREEKLTVSFELVNRSEQPVRIERVHLQPADHDTLLQHDLAFNQVLNFEQEVSISDAFEYTNPYWLNAEPELGMYVVDNQQLIGLPETPRQFVARYEFNIAGIPVALDIPVVHKRTDPVDGEVYRPFEVTPPAFANFQETVYIFQDQAPQTIEVRVRAGKDSIQGALRLEAPEDWSIQPAQMQIALEKRNMEKVYAFEVTPPAEQSEGDLSPVLTIDGADYERGIDIIDYDHIPVQTVLQKASTRVVRIKLEKRGERIGYLMGAGDAVPASLEQIGYDVELLDPANLTGDQLATYDAILIGIRAYNTEERMAFIQPLLMDYVKQGGTMVVQYNTTRGLKIQGDEIGPYPLQLSRDRVTVEEAPVRFLAPDHPVLNQPNRITQQDFEGWVQERGLYFPDEWDSAYTPILSSNDPGEDPKDGGLLVAKYGEGYYVYSGYSWFRELPAGVAGAYRLFANIISLGQEDRP